MTPDEMREKLVALGTIVVGAALVIAGVQFKAGMAELIGAGVVLWGLGGLT